MNMDNKGTTTSYEGVLPSHMPFDIWEVYARLVLQFLDEATYRNLSHRDKPDLWDELCVSSRGFEQKEHRKLSSRSIGSAHAF